MTRLLVSVRSFDEACLAAEVGVDLIDLKEPRNGSLGRVRLEMARQVCQHFSEGHLLSMALGELAEWSDADWALVGQIPRGIVYAKIGLAECEGLPDWRANWQRASRSLSPHCQSVAVIYADWREARAPQPESVLDLALENGCRALLVDTWRKDRENVFRHCGISQVDALFDRAKQYGLLTVLAGSLSLDNLDEALSTSPDYLAVRGAVCAGTREGELVPEKIRCWRDLISEHRSLLNPAQKINRPIWDRRSA